MQIHKYQSYRDEVLNLGLARIALLEDGWFDGDGTKYTGADLDMVGDYIDAIFAADESIEAPDLIPDKDGRLRAEWHTAFKDLVLIFFDSPNNVWGLVTTSTGGVNALGFSLRVPEGPQAAAVFITVGLKTEPTSDLSPYKEEGE